MLMTFLVVFMGFMARGRLTVVAWTAARGVVVGWSWGQYYHQHQPPVTARPSRR